MIRYFRKLSIFKLTELACGLMAVAFLCILLTGGDVFESAKHVNLSSVDEAYIRSGMYVELEVNEVLDVFADDKDLKSYYYIIPYPKTGEDKNDEISLIALVVGDSYKDKIDEILLATASDLRINNIPKLNGKIIQLNSNEEKLFKEKCNEVISDYNLENVNIIPYAFKAVTLNIWDYLAATFALVVLVGYLVLLIFILSGKNEENVRAYIKKRGLIVDKLITELKEGKKYDTVLLSKNYIAFVIKLKVYLLGRDDVINIKQMSKDGEGNDASKNMIIITTSDENNYIVPIKNDKIKKLLEEF